MGSKFGGGGVAGASETNVDRRERLRKLALETIDLAKVRMPPSIACVSNVSQDPYINHLGSLECRLCLTLHTNEGSYLAHMQGKKHQTNLARRAARDAKETQLMVAPAQSNVQRKVFLKIGRPGYCWSISYIPYLVLFDYLIIATSHTSFYLSLLSDLLSILQV